MSPFFLLCSTAISRKRRCLSKGGYPKAVVFCLFALILDASDMYTPGEHGSEKRGEVDGQSRIALGPAPASGCATGSPGMNYRTGRLVGIFATEASDQHGLENGHSLHEDHFRRVHQIKACPVDRQHS
jgi:hypothetical protein